MPDSCCLFESPGCGSDLFAVNDLRVIFIILSPSCYLISLMSKPQIVQVSCFNPSLFASQVIIGKINVHGCLTVMQVERLILADV